MQHTHLKKDLSFWLLTGLGMSSIIASGIYTLPAALVTVAGSYMIYSVVLCGLICFLFALPYAEMSSTFIMPGGPFGFDRLAMGNLTGFLLGWAYFLYLILNTAATAEMSTIYLALFFPQLAIHGVLTSLGLIVALCILWLFTLLNIFSCKGAGISSLVTSCIKIVVLLFFVVTASFFLKKENFFSHSSAGYGNLFLGISVFFWAFAGFEVLTIPMSEIQSPKKNIPKALFLALFISFILYLLVTLVFANLTEYSENYTHKWSEITERPMPLLDLTEMLNKKWLFILVALSGAIGITGSIGTTIFFQGRIPFVMARDRLFWQPLSKVNPQLKTPTAAIIFGSCLATLVLFVIPYFPFIYLLAVIAILIPYGGAALSAVILRKAYPEKKRVFRLPYIKTISLLSFVVASFLIYWASWPWTFVGTVMVCFGYVVFFLSRYREPYILRSLWLGIHLLGIGLVSYLGDTHFVFSNFTSIKPLGILPIPYDLIILSLWSVLIFIFAYRHNTLVFLKKAAHIKSLQKDVKP